MDDDITSDDIEQRVTAALARYRAADAAMHTRARQASGMTDNELRIVQFLMSENDSERAVTPTLIARHLGITSASTTALLDRLERSGVVQRARHPSDRRSLHIQMTPRGYDTVDTSLEVFADALRRVSSELSASERRTVVGFFDRLTAEAEAIGEMQPIRRIG
ncbi:MarR family transcriptional regulator [Microbacterium sp. W1N]|uniref:MarR family winged helix-turn-helix transcriptional regulator n=1 Tax=Microbacterium festucae TaxID=2977531 RepID=UPI0021C1B37D|nr:MarR family transcriptional regulator [Microbacterium festucae]MCT9821257.1 MarR family transcriptional regulator [Microbacterium festucae]